MPSEHIRHDRRRDTHDRISRTLAALHARTHQAALRQRRRDYRPDPAARSKRKSFVNADRLRFRQHFFRMPHRMLDTGTALRVERERRRQLKRVGARLRIRAHHLLLRASIHSFPHRYDGAASPSASARRETTGGAPPPDTLTSFIPVPAPGSTCTVIAIMKRSYAQQRPRHTYTSRTVCPRPEHTNLQCTFFDSYLTDRPTKIAATTFTDKHGSTSGDSDHPFGHPTRHQRSTIVTGSRRVRRSRHRDC